MVGCWLEETLAEELAGEEQAGAHPQLWLLCEVKLGAWTAACSLLPRELFKARDASFAPTASS